MKKIIAICLTILYLGLITGTLIPSGKDIIPYERSFEGNGNEKNESETSKETEIFHVFHVSKHSFRLKFQNLAQGFTFKKAIATTLAISNKRLTSPDNFPLIDNPIFLRNRVFRL